MNTPHPSVVRHIREYRSNLKVVYNPRWTEEFEKFLICQTVKKLTPVDEDAGLYVVGEEEFPVLFIPQASEIDRRWTRELDKNRIDKREDDATKAKRQKKEIMKNYTDEADAWSRDVGHWHFKREIDPYNLALLPNKDPTRETKELEDKTGEEVGL